MRSRRSAICLGLALGIAHGAARAQGVDEAPAASPLDALDVVAMPRLTPPALLHELVPPAPHVELPKARDKSRDARALSLDVGSLDLGLQVFRLAVHGDGKPGLSTFLGTSTTSLGGFRLRF